MKHIIIAVLFLAFAFTAQAAPTTTTKHAHMASTVNDYPCIWISRGTVSGEEQPLAGYNALYSNTTGSNNSAQGLNALYSNTTGYNNSAQGGYALYSNTTGNYNSAHTLSCGTMAPSPGTQSLPSPSVTLPGLPAQPKLDIVPMPSQHAGIWIWDKFMQLWNCKICWNQPLEWCWYPPVNPD